MLPLVAILTITAIKDGIEDYRRAKLDDEVNNSAATKLGGWKNVNQPKDPRTFAERLFGMPNPSTSCVESLEPVGQKLTHTRFVSLADDKTSKGVRKLREKEAREGKEIVLKKSAKVEDLEQGIEETVSHDTSGDNYRMDDIQSVSPHHYASMGAEGRCSLIFSAILSLPQIDSHGHSEPRLGGSHPDLGYLSGRGRAGSVGSYQPSVATSAPPRSSIGVVDWDRSSPGTAKWERTLWYVQPSQILADILGTDACFTPYLALQEEARGRRHRAPPRRRAGACRHCGPVDC